MKKHLPLVLLFILALTAPAAGNPGPEALGTVQYDVRYKLGALNTKVADATISLESSTWNGQSVLHSHASIKAKSIFKLFMKAGYEVDLYLTPTQVEPIYYINPFKNDGQDGKVEFTYDRGKKTIESVAVRPPEEAVVQTLPLDGKTMDLLSALQHARFLNLASGGSESLSLIKSGRVIQATLTNQGIDNERFPGHEAERMQLKMIGEGLMENGSGNVITLWRSTGADRCILGVEVALSSGTMIVGARL